MQDIATLATFNDAGDEISDAAIFIQGNVIQWVGKTSDLPQEYSSADKVLSLKDHVLMPGMVSWPLCICRLLLHRAALPIG